MMAQIRAIRIFDARSGECMGWIPVQLVTRELYTPAQNRYRMGSRTDVFTWVPAHTTRPMDFLDDGDCFPTEEAALEAVAHLVPGKTGPAIYQPHEQEAKNGTD